MKTQSDTQSGNLLLPSVYDDQLHNGIIFYSLKFHFIMVPVLIVMAIVHLKFGTQYLGECPIEPMINIYMIVHAGTYLSFVLLNSFGVINIHCIYPRYKLRNDKTIPRMIFYVIAIFTLLILIFNLAWLMAGSAWIIGVKANGIQGSNPTATTTYCQSDFHKVALALLVVDYVLYGLIIFLCCK